MIPSCFTSVMGCCGNVLASSARKGKSCKTSCQGHVRTAKSDEVSMLRGWLLCILKWNVPRICKNPNSFIFAIRHPPDLDLVSASGPPPAQHHRGYTSWTSTGSLTISNSSSRAIIWLVTGGQWSEEQGHTASPRGASHWCEDQASSHLSYFFCRLLLFLITVAEIAEYYVDAPWVRDRITSLIGHQQRAHTIC